MYILRHRNKYGQSYLKYNGWVEYAGENPTIDLKDCILFTKGESLANKLPLSYEWVHFPSIAPIKE